MRVFDFAFAALSLLALVSGCGGSEEQPKGASPVITDLTFDKTVVAKGKPEVVNATLVYSDPDGDVAKIFQQVTPPVGSPTTKPQEVVLTGTSGKTEGTHAIAFQVLGNTGADVEIAFWIADAKGNESSHVKKTITVQ